MAARRRLTTCETDHWNGMVLVLIGVTAGLGSSFALHAYGRVLFRRLRTDAVSFLSYR